MYAPSNTSSAVGGTTATTTTTSAPPQFSPCKSDCNPEFECLSLNYGNRQFRVHFRGSDSIDLCIDVSSSLPDLVEKTSLIVLNMKKLPQPTARAVHALMNRGAVILSIRSDQLALRCHPVDITDSCQLTTWLNNVGILSAFNREIESCDDRLEELALEVVQQFKKKCSLTLGVRKKRNLVTELGLLAPCVRSSVFGALFTSYLEASKESPAGAAVVILSGHAEMIRRAPKCMLDGNELWALAKDLVPQLHGLLTTGCEDSRAHERSRALLDLVTAILSRLAELELLLSQPERELIRWVNIRLRQAYGRGDKVSQVIKNAASHTRHVDNSQLLFRANLMQQALARCSSDESRLGGIARKGKLLYNIFSSMGNAATKMASTVLVAQDSTKIASLPKSVHEAATSVGDFICALSGLKRVAEKPKKPHIWYDMFCDFEERLHNCRDDLAKFNEVWKEFERSRDEGGSASWLRRHLPSSLNRQWTPHDMWNLVYGLVEWLAKIIEDGAYNDDVRTAALTKLQAIAQWNQIKGDVKAVKRAKARCEALTKAADRGLRSWLERHGIKLQDPDDSNALSSEKATPTDLLQEAQRTRCELELKARKLQNEFRKDAPYYVPTRIVGGNAAPANGLELFAVVRNFLSSDDQTVMVLTGEPGCGKTTAALSVVDLLSEQDSEYLPVFVKLSEIRSRSDDDRFLGPHIDKEIGESAKSKYLIVLDGGDEIDPVPDFFGLHHLSKFENSKFLITCRASYYTDNRCASSFAPNYATGPNQKALCEWQVCPFNSDERYHFIQWWVDSTNNRAGWTVEQFTDRIFKSGLDKYTYQPFDLRLVLEVLPGSERRGRAGLYDQYVVRRFDSEISRLRDGDSHSDACLEFARHLALEMFVKGRFNINLMSCSDKLVDVHARLKDRLGILSTGSCPLREESGGNFTFAHPSLRNFFAARAILCWVMDRHVGILSEIRQIFDSNQDQEVVEFFQSLFLEVDDKGEISDRIRNAFDQCLSDPKFRHNAVRFLPKRSALVTVEMLYASALALVRSNDGSGLAKVWFQRAMNRGCPEAQAMYASLERENQPRHFAAASQSMLASDPGCPEAEYRVGEYFRKSGQDSGKALSHFTRLGERFNDQRGLYELGCTYWNGEGVGVSRERAENYFRRAAASGSEAASCVLRDLVEIRRSRNTILRVYAKWIEVFYVWCEAASI